MFLMVLQCITWCLRNAFVSLPRVVKPTIEHHPIISNPPTPPHTLFRDFGAFSFAFECIPFLLHISGVLISMEKKEKNTTRNSIKRDIETKWISISIVRENSLKRKKKKRKMKWNWSHYRFREKSSKIFMLIIKVIFLLFFFSFFFFVLFIKDLKLGLLIIYNFFLFFFLFCFNSWYILWWKQCPFHLVISFIIRYCRTIQSKVLILYFPFILHLFTNYYFIIKFIRME